MISNVIAALDWVVANKASYNVRVVNLSVGAAVTESYHTDPLTRAAKRAVDAGIVVVTAAGNLGKNAHGQLQYGGITAPGNAPWVLTVGAFSHEGTVIRTDDVMAGYSSRGPTAIDFAAKPDLVAPGTGIVSLSDPTSLMYVTKAAYLLAGSLLPGVQAISEPHRDEHGVAGGGGNRCADDAGEPHSDAEHGQGHPAVHGAIGLRLQRAHAGRGLPELLRCRAAGAGSSGPLSPVRSCRCRAHGASRSSGGTIASPVARFGRMRMPSSWAPPGAPLSMRDGDNIVWGTLLRNDGDNLVWGTADC